MAWTDAQQNPHDYLAPGAGVGYSGGISGQYPIGLGVGNYAGALRLGGAPSAASVPNPTARPTFPGSLIPLPSGRPGSSPGPFGAVGNAGPRGATNAAPVSVSQALATSATKGGRSPPGYQGVATVPEIESYIRERAGLLGMDQDYAVAVFRGEGRSGYIGDQSLGGSYGPYQLYMGGGVGNRFVKDTGLDLRDPSTWRQQVDYALNTAINEGWGAWNGRPGGRSGPTRVGLNGAHAIDVSGYGATDTLYGGTMPNPNMRPGRTTDARGGPMSSGQFLSAIGPQPRPIGPNDYLVPPGQNIDALTYTGEPAASPTNAVFRLPNANTPPPVSPAATPSIAGGQPYTVKPNDTLWGIAAQTLGDPTQWPTIAQANGIRRGQERNIQPGQQLVIPGGAPGAPPPMPNTTAQGFGPMPPVPTPQARPSIPAPGIPDPRLRPGNQPGPFSSAVSRETVSPSTAGTGPDQFRFANAGLGQQTTRMGLQPGVLPQLPEPVGGRQPSAEDQYRLATSGSGNQTTNMSMQPYTLPQLPFPNLPTDTPWGNVPTRQQSAQSSPPAGPGMDLTGYIPPVSRMEQALGNVPMALPLQQTPMDPAVAAAIAATPAVITDQPRPNDSRGRLARVPEFRSGNRMAPANDPIARALQGANEIQSDPSGVIHRYLQWNETAPAGLNELPTRFNPNPLDPAVYSPVNQRAPAPYQPGERASWPRIAANITNRDIRIITARTPPVYVAPDGSRIWQII